MYTNSVANSFITQLKKTVPIKILTPAENSKSHDQRTTSDAVVPFYKLTDVTLYEHFP